jgi:hypothetical protein
VLTKEEEAAALAQAEYDDIMGNFELDPEDYTILRAQNIEDAKREAEESVGAAGRTMTRSATISGEPIGVVCIRCGFVRRSAEGWSFTAPPGSISRPEIGVL